MGGIARGVESITRGWLQSAQENRMLETKANVFSEMGLISEDDLLKFEDGNKNKRRQIISEAELKWQLGNKNLQNQFTAKRLEQADNRLMMQQDRMFNNANPDLKPLPGRPGYGYLQSGQIMTVPRAEPVNPIDPNDPSLSVPAPGGGQYIKKIPGYQYQKPASSPSGGMIGLNPINSGAAQQPSSAAPAAVQSTDVDKSLPNAYPKPDGQWAVAQDGQKLKLKSGITIMWDANAGKWIKVLEAK